MAETFFLTPEQEASQQRFDPLRVACITAFSLPTEWDYFAWDAKHFEKKGTVVVEGGIPRAGVEHYSEKWRGVPTMRVTIYGQQIEAAKRAYEGETGRCHACSGNGYVWASSSVGAPTRYRNCGRCSGSGVAPFANATADSDPSRVVLGQGAV